MTTWNVIVSDGYELRFRQKTVSASGLNERLYRYGRHIIKATLAARGGNISEAARILHVDRTNLSRKIKDMKLMTRWHVICSINLKNGGHNE